MELKRKVYNKMIKWKNEYTPNSIRTVVKYLKQELEPVGKLTIKL